MIQVLDYILHVDKYLHNLILEYGILVYFILFLIVFLETGLVVTPFLPGDSLLFAVGALTAVGLLNLPAILALLIFAAIIGDTLNYWIGYHFGTRIFTKDKSLLFNKNHLITTQNFYHKHGGKTIVLARFIPIIRTFAPFVAGIGKMDYLKFLIYNVFGGFIWVLLFILGGYFFGNIPIVKDNFGLVIIGIIIVSVIPLIIKFFKRSS